MTRSLCILENEVHVYNAFQTMKNETPLISYTQFIQLAYTDQYATNGVQKVFIISNTHTRKSNKSVPHVCIFY